MGSTPENQLNLGFAQIGDFRVAKRVGMGTRDAMVKTNEMYHSMSCTMTRTPQSSVTINLTSDDEELPHTALRSRSTRRDVGAPSSTPINDDRPASPIFTSTLKRSTSDNGLCQLLNHRETHGEVSTLRINPLRSRDLRTLTDSHLYDMLVCAETKGDCAYDELPTENRYRPLPSSNLGHLGNGLSSQSVVTQGVTQSTPETGLEQTLSMNLAFANNRLETIESWGGKTNRKRNQPMDAVTGQERRVKGPKRRKEMNEGEDQADGIVMEQTAMRTRAEERRRTRDEERLKSRARRNAARLTSDNAFKEQKRDRQAGYQTAFVLDRAVDLTLETPSEDDLFTEEQISSPRTARGILDYQGRYPNIKHERENSRPDAREGGPPSTSSVLQAVTFSDDDFTVETRKPELPDTLIVGTLGGSPMTDVRQVTENGAIEGFIRSSVSSRPIHILHAPELPVQELSKTAIKSHDGVVESALPSAAPEAYSMEIDDNLHSGDLCCEAVSSVPVEVLSYPDRDLATTGQRSEVPSDESQDQMASVTSDLAEAYLIKSLQDIDSQKQRTRLITFEDELNLIARNKKARRDAYPVQYRARHRTGTHGLHRRVYVSQRSAGDGTQPVAPFSKSNKPQRPSAAGVEPARNNTFPSRQNREPERQVETQRSSSTSSHDSQVHSMLASSTCPKGFAAWTMLDDNSSGIVEGAEKTQRKRDYGAERLRREDKRHQEEQAQDLVGSSYSQISSGISSSQSTDPQPVQRKNKTAYNARRNKRRREQRSLARELGQGKVMSSPNSTRTVSFTLAANHDGEQVDLETIDTLMATISEDELKRIRSEKVSSQRRGQEDQKLSAIKAALKRFKPDEGQNIDMDSQRSAPANENNAETQPEILYRYESTSSSDEDDDEQVGKRRELQYAEQVATVQTVDTVTAGTPDHVIINPFRQTKGGKGLSPASRAILEAEEVKLKDLAGCPASGMSQESDDDDKIEHGVAQAHFQYFVERIEYFHNENKDEIEGTTYGPYFLLEEANIVAREILTPAQRGLEICPPSYVGLGKDATGMDSYDLEVKDGRIETSINRKLYPPQKLPRSIINHFRPEKSYIAYQKVVPDDGPASTRTLGVFTVPDLANKEAGMAWLANATNELTLCERDRIKKIEIESGMRRILVELEEREGLFRDWVGEVEFWVEEHDTRGPRN